MRPHKTSAGRVIRGIGLLLCVLALAPEMGREAATASDLAIVENAVDVAGLPPAARRVAGRGQAVASVTPDAADRDSDCVAHFCGSMALGNVPDAQHARTNPATDPVAGTEGGQLSNGTAEGIVAWRNTAGSVPGSRADIDRLWPGGSMLGIHPTGQGPQALGPILLALTHPDDRLNPDVAGLATERVVPDSSGAAPTASQADTPAAVPVGTVHALAPTGPGSVNRHDVFLSPATDALKPLPGLGPLPSLPTVEPLGVPHPAAVVPLRKLDPTPDGDNPMAVPGVRGVGEIQASEGPHGDGDARASAHPAGAVSPVVLDRVFATVREGDGDSIGGRRDSDATPKNVDGPVGQLFNGLEHTADNIAEDLRMLADGTEVPLNTPAREVTTLAALAAAEVAEPSTVALIGLAALALAVTGQSLRRRRHRPRDFAASPSSRSAPMPAS